MFEPTNYADVTVRLRYQVHKQIADQQGIDELGKAFDDLFVTTDADSLELERLEIETIDHIPSDQAATRKFTVVFFIDGVRGVEHFVEHVEVASPSNAFEAAVQQARTSGHSSTGHHISSEEWENATEIAVFSGHCEDARGKQVEPLYVNEPFKAAACPNCGNTLQDGSPDCLDCGLEGAFA